MADFAFTAAEIEEARRRGDEERARRPRPVSVRYDAPSGRIVLEFANGAAFTVPVRSLQGLGEAGDEALSRVEILGDDGLRWDALDVDFTIAGLMSGVFGTARFMEETRAKDDPPLSPAGDKAIRTSSGPGRRPRRAV